MGHRSLLFPCPRPFRVLFCSCAAPHRGHGAELEHAAAHGGQLLRLRGAAPLRGARRGGRGEAGPRGQAARQRRARGCVSLAALRLPPREHARSVCSRPGASPARTLTSAARSLGRRAGLVSRRPASGRRAAQRWPHRGRRRPPQAAGRGGGRGAPGLCVGARMRCCTLHRSAETPLGAQGDADALGAPRAAKPRAGACARAAGARSRHFCRDLTNRAFCSAQGWIQAPLAQRWQHARAQAFAQGA